MLIVDAPAAQRVGRYALSVGPTGRSTEIQAKWSRRAEALAAWLLAERHREHATERN